MLWHQRDDGAQMADTRGRAGSVTHRAPVADHAHAAAACCYHSTTCWPSRASSSAPQSAVRGWTVTCAVTAWHDCRIGVQQIRRPRPASGSRSTPRATSTSTSSTCRRCRTRHRAATGMSPSTGPRVGYTSKSCPISAPPRPQPSSNTSAGERRSVSARGSPTTPRPSPAASAPPASAISRHPCLRSRLCRASDRASPDPAASPANQRQDRAFQRAYQRRARRHALVSGADLAATLARYLWLYNHGIPQKALGHLTPVAALKQW